MSVVDSPPEVGTTTWAIPGAAAWSLVVPRHHTLSMRCAGPGANASMLIYVDRDRTERLNVPDTLKAQMSARIKPGMVLMSDMGRALASVTGSSLDWHDAISGHRLDSDWRRSARDGLLQELAKHDLGVRDLHATVNWFSKVAPSGDERGTFAFHPDHATTDDWAELRTELDVLVVLSTQPHPLDPATTWPPPGVDVALRPAAPPEEDDACRVSRAEAGRAITLSERGLA